MTKMATMPIYGINPLKIFPGTSGPIFTKLDKTHRRLKRIIFCSQMITWIDHELFYGMVKFFNLGFYMGKCDNHGYLEKYCIL